MKGPFAPFGLSDEAMEKNNESGRRGGLVVRGLTAGARRKEIRIGMLEPGHRQ